MQGDFEQRVLGHGETTIDWPQGRAGCVEVSHRHAAIFSHDHALGLLQHLDIALENFFFRFFGNSQERNILLSTKISQHELLSSAKTEGARKNKNGLRKQARRPSN